MSQTHKDVYFEIEDAHGRDVGRAASKTSIKSFDEAASLALNAAITTGKAQLDVVVWSEAGARFVGGSDGVERYREDPEASVFERFEIKVNAVGRVP